ncbi:copper amine oxidase [Paenalkalicoccus suaedae]|uniref:Copper amine oxidase n=1 Tax=Paenalkalicoccus suaedae TaxID=2592382 RepID=A0A859FJ12_9BACI|nr:copper amine oxidase [Paenalkalicoccus suaedae]QKS72874.1 copper amine oxidase [Paenalkalicoccus suaedae]
MKKVTKRIIAPVLATSLLLPTVAGAAHEAPSASTPAGDLRATLDELLSEHFVLAVTSMMKQYDEAPDAMQVTDALDQNAADMTPAIASIYGDEGAAEFERIFRGHNDYTDDFVTAALNDDDALREEALMEVDEFVDEFSTFLDAATEGNLPKETAASVLALHEEQVLGTFDAYVAGDYEQSWTTFREGFDLMYDISGALSVAITTQMPDAFENTAADTPAVGLRSTLNQLASEHFALASLGLQKGFEEAPDYDFVTWAEDMNTADFTAAIASIYGDEGAAQFETLWTQNHIVAEADLVSALVAGDDAAREEAQDRLLNEFAPEFGAFLGAATEENLPTEAAIESVQIHEQQKQDTINAYVAGDFDAAWDNFREGYSFMFGVGEALGGAIVAQFPDNFAEGDMPEEMPRTGLGGSQSNDLTMLYVGLGTILAAGGVFFLRRKTSNEA